LIARNALGKHLGEVQAKTRELERWCQEQTPATPPSRDQLVSEIFDRRRLFCRFPAFFPSELVVFATFLCFISMFFPEFFLMADFVWIFSTVSVWMGLGDWMEMMADRTGWETCQSRQCLVEANVRGDCGGKTRPLWTPFIVWIVPFKTAVSISTPISKRCFASSFFYLFANFLFTNFFGRKSFDRVMFGYFGSFPTFFVFESFLFIDKLAEKKFRFCSKKFHFVKIVNSGASSGPSSVFCSCDLRQDRVETNRALPTTTIW
jgi:hypothetical protein